MDHFARSGPHAPRTWAFLHVVVALVLAGCGQDGAQPPVADAAIADAAHDACDQSIVDAAASLQTDATVTTVPCKQFDLPAGVCFQAAPPKPGDFVADLAQPASPCADVGAPPWFDAASVPAPTLPVQVGYRDKQGQFVPYQNGDWVPLQTANQGGFHVELVPAVDLPCQATAVMPLSIQSFAAAECNEIATLGTNKATFIHTGDSRWTLRPEAKLFTVFGTSIANMAPYCGIWVHVWWRVRIPGTNQWGEVIRVLRTWDGTCNAASP